LQDDQAAAALRRADGNFGVPVGDYYGGVDGGIGYEALEKDKGLALLHDESDGCGYEVRGRILEYERGSGFLRFMIGFGAGSAKVVTELSLIDRHDGRIVFSGNFEGLVTNWKESGAEIYKSVATDFRKAIKKSGGCAADPKEEDGPLL
jgi:hypothetical protein